MDQIVAGKFVRSDTVKGVIYSPAIERCFEDMSNGVEDQPVLPQGHMPLYQIDTKTLRDFGIDGHIRNPLRDQNGNINLHFLLAEGIGECEANFDDPVQALSKWFPKESEKRHHWEEYVGERGFEIIPPPPGIIVEGCENKYSNTALKEVMKKIKNTSKQIHKEFIQPAEFQFKIDVSANG